ncbi:50S ribosomal protein L10, partial [Acinetobacter baumannii]|nr:50S ribosomal protein L10 [Acinetobacter baumannii]
FSSEHLGAAARLFKDFAKANPAFEIKAAAFEGEFIPGSNIDRLATLPTYEEAIARLMSTMKEAAAGKLVRTLAALRDQKEAA